MDNVWDDELSEICNEIGTSLYFSVYSVRSSNRNCDRMYEITVSCIEDIVELARTKEVKKHLEKWLYYYDLFMEDELYGGTQFKDTVALTGDVEAFAKKFWSGEITVEEFCDSMTHMFSRFGFDRNHTAWKGLREKIDEMANAPRVKYQRGICHDSRILIDKNQRL